MSSYRKCYVCGIEKPMDEFYNDVSQSGGKKYECKDCCKKLSKEWQLKNPHRYWSRYVLNNHKHNGYDIQLSVDELTNIAKQTDICPICGKLLVYNNGTNKKQSLDSPSLDRINNENILTVDNTWIICLECNNLKSVKPLADFVKFCDMVATKFNHLL